MDRLNPKRHQPDICRPLETGPWMRSSWTSDATAHAGYAMMMMTMYSFCIPKFQNSLGNMYLPGVKKQILIKTTTVIIVYLQPRQRRLAFCLTRPRHRMPAASAACLSGLSDLDKTRQKRPESSQSPSQAPAETRGGTWKCQCQSWIFNAESQSFSSALSVLNNVQIIPF